VNAVGFCEARLELCDKALAHCTAAAQLLEHTTHRHGQAAVWDSLGFIYARTGNLRQAARSYERDRPVPLGRITFRGSGPLFPDAWPSRTAGRHGSKFRAGRGAGARGQEPRGVRITGVDLEPGDLQHLRTVSTARRNARPVPVPARPAAGKRPVCDRTSSGLRCPTCQDISLALAAIASGTPPLTGH
jgi:hypothetical protein